MRQPGPPPKQSAAGASRASAVCSGRSSSAFSRRMWTQITHTMAVASSFDLTALARVLDDDDFDPALEERTRVTCSIFDEYERKPEGGINFISTEEIESQRYAAFVFFE